MFERVGERFLSYPKTVSSTPAASSRGSLGPPRTPGSPQRDTRHEIVKTLETRYRLEKMLVRLVLRHASSRRISAAPGVRTRQRRWPRAPFRASPSSVPSAIGERDHDVEIVRDDTCISRAISARSAAAAARPAVAFALEPAARSCNVTSTALTDHHAQQRGGTIGPLTRPRRSGSRKTTAPRDDRSQLGTSAADTRRARSSSRATRTAPPNRGVGRRGIEISHSTRLISTISANARRAATMKYQQRWQRHAEHDHVGW